MTGKSKIVMSYIASITETKGMGHRHLQFNVKRSSWMHKGHYGRSGPANDHSPKRCLGDVWSIPEP
jgi:hypothetical protein